MRESGARAAEHPAVAAVAVLKRLEDNVARVVRGKREVIRLAIAALLADGHVLIEDVPGVGKTMLAQALSRSLGLSFQRIQFTSDLLPSDIIGVSVYDLEQRQFRFNRGPLFANVVLADEINRATPKTQSALLEAMSEGQVTVDRDRYALPQPFLVLATQNPLEHQGTFPLPESQLDRFLMSLQIGYPSHLEERELLLSGGVEAELAGLMPVLEDGELARLQLQVAEVRVADKLADYLVAIATASRSNPELLLGVSTRGVQGLCRACQALAFLEGRPYVTPDDVQRLAPVVLAHRVVVRQRAGDDVRRRTIERIVRAVPVPI